jgi:FeS assembly SUF system protein
LDTAGALVANLGNVQMNQEADTLQSPSAPENAERAFLVATAPDPKVIYEAVVAALRTVYDPEIPVNIYDLGLIYRIDIIDRKYAEIDMTLTAPGCPVAGEMLNMAQKAVEGVESVTSVKVNLVFDPPWDKSMMSEEAKLELGFVDLM